MEKPPATTLVSIQVEGKASALSHKRFISLLVVSLTGLAEALYGQTANLLYVSNLPALKAVSISGLGAGTTIMRGGYYSPGDGGNSLYTLSLSSCSLNAGTGDNGSQVKPNVGTGCWISAANSAPLVQVFGGDPTGTNDSSSALQACLNAAGSMGQCLVSGGRYKILSSINIPAHTTISCGVSFGDNEDPPTGLNTISAMLLGGAYSFSAAGQGAAIRNCVILQSGLTFPTSDSSGFAGIAVEDGGNSNFSVQDTEIVGFDTDIYITGSRPFIHRDYVDGAGLSHAAVEIDTGNTDSGYVDDLKIQPIATGSGSCVASLRPGTGVRIGGTGGPGVWFDNVIAQNFNVADFEFAVAALVGKIWADDLGLSCGYSSAIGVKSIPQRPCFPTQCTLTRQIQDS